MNLIKLIFFLLFLTPFKSQAQPDSTTLNYQEYLEYISRFHPLAKQAKLQTELAEAEQLAAKGNLDPSIDFSWNEKDFDEKIYYRQYQGKFKIPTILGVDITGGYENTNGVFLNPENSTNDLGLWHLGIEANVLQGLIVNERKIAFELANVFQDMSQNKQDLLLNDLYYKASKAYLEWQQFYYFQEVIKENVALSSTYLKNTKSSFEGGEKTAMDTLEAYIIYQDAQNLLQKSQASLNQAIQNMENFLWLDEKPISLSPNTKPQNYTKELQENSTRNETAIIVNNHPLISSYLNKKSYYEIEQKLKREKLKPKLKLKYNPLFATSNNLAPNFSSSNLKWGIDFSMPILYREERANIQKGKIKIQETGFDIENKKNELNNKLENSLQQQNILKEQIALSQQNLEGYKRLLDGENEKFLYGESSVFLVNKRQEKYINAQLKLIELNIKSQKELVNFLYYSNQLLL